MKTIREFNRAGPCITLGEFIRETATRYVYRTREGRISWAGKSTGLVHVEPCHSCRDHPQTQYPNGHDD